MKIPLVASGLALGLSFILIRPITISNRITPKSLGVKKFLFSYEPKKFTLFVNGTKLKPDEHAAITSDILEVEYEYLWKTPVGKKAGRKKARFKIDPNQQQATITFAGWHEKNRILVDGAQQLDDEQTVYSQGSIAHT